MSEKTNNGNVVYALKSNRRTIKTVNKMSQYINYTCPKCRTSLSGGYRRTTFKGGLGLPFIQCPSCHALATTGLQPYSRFETGKKIFYWIGATIVATVWGLIVGSVAQILILSSIVEIDKLNSYYLIPLPLLLFVGQLWIYYRNIQTIENYNMRRDWTLKL